MTSNQLPIEINEMIAEHCDIKTLMKFQYTSKNAYYGVESHIKRCNKGFVKDVIELYDRFLNKMKFQIIKDLVLKNTPAMTIADMCCRSMKDSMWIRMLKDYINNSLDDYYKSNTLEFLVRRELLKYVNGNFNLLNSYIICKVIEISSVPKDVTRLKNHGSSNLQFLETFGNNFKETQRVLSYNMIHKNVVKKEDIEIVSKHYVNGDIIEHILCNKELYNFSDAKLYSRIGYYQLKNYTDICLKNQDLITKFVYDNVKTFLLSRNTKMYKIIKKYETQIINKQIKIKSFNGDYLIGVKSREYIKNKEQYKIQYQQEYNKMYNKLFV